MSGIEGYYYEGDSGFQYYPGKVFSLTHGPRGGKRKDEPLDREFWQEVSGALQQNHGLRAYQARELIYELEERYMGAKPSEIELIYHWSPKRIAEDIVNYEI